MAIAALSREYTPGACHNSRKLMRLPPRRKMRPDSPALWAEEFHIPNQTRKEPWCPWWNSRESPRTLTQDEKKTVVTSRMQNRLVYRKSTQEEAHFPLIGSIAIPHSTSYKTSGLTSFMKIQDSLRHTSQVLSNINFSKATGGKLRTLYIMWRWELIPFLQW